MSKPAPFMGYRRTCAATSSHQLTKGCYATPRQKSPRPAKGLWLQSREQLEILALVGFMVQLGEPRWSGSVFHFHCAIALDFKPGLRLEIASTKKDPCTGPF